MTNQRIKITTSEPIRRETRPEVLSVSADAWAEYVRAEAQAYAALAPALADYAAARTAAFERYKRRLGAAKSAGKLSHAPID